MEIKNCPEVTAKLAENLSLDEYLDWLHKHLETCEYCQSLIDNVKEEESNDTE